MLSASDFDYVRALVQRRSAIVLESEKIYLAEARLVGLARREGFDSPTHLVSHLRSAPNAELHHRVVEAMTTNETSFFRDVQPFEALKKVVLPELIGRRAVERQLNVWCAACSTGQEPVTIALVLREHFPALLNWRVRILATDLSTVILERARRGRYSQMEVNRGMPAALLVKYFDKVGLDWQLKEPVRKLIEYGPLNLIEPWPHLPSLDVVFLRNVLIYFDVETKKRILEKVRRVLRADGALFLGGAETTFNLDDAFERIDFERGGAYRLRKR